MCYDIALQNRSDCRNNTNKRSGIPYIYDLKRKGQDKKQSSGDLVDSGMDCCQRVTADESDHDIDKLDKCDHAYPYNDPHRKFKDSAGALSIRLRQKRYRQGYRASRQIWLRYSFFARSLRQGCQISRQQHKANKTAATAAHRTTARGCILF